MAVRPLHQLNGYTQRAKQCVTRADRNPNTRCWRCGLTMVEIRLKMPGRKIWWTAGHTKDHDSSKPILAEHSYCNFKAGQAVTQDKKMPHSNRVKELLNDRPI